MRLFATCARGFEDLSAAEVDELVGACATVDRDKVFFAATWAQVCALQVRARTLHKVHLLLARGPVKTLDDVRAVARGVDWAAHLQPTQAFGVEGIRSGTHDFTSVDIGRAVGGVVQQEVEKARGAKPPVNLDQPEVQVTALVRDEECLLGLNLTGDTLHKRGYRVYQHPAPLRPSLAAVLLRWAGYTPEQALWDPLCGSATLPIEAALMARRIPPNATRPFLMEHLHGFPAEALAAARAAALAERTDPPLRLLGTERFETHLLGAAANARAAGVWDALHLRVLDVARARREDLPFAPDLVVTNPPYGLRIASTGVVRRLYQDFLAKMEVLEVAQVVVLVGNRMFEQEAARRGLQPAEALDVVYGDLPARALRFRLR